MHEAMDSSILQSRGSTATYFPPHRTQLHPRMHIPSFSSSPTLNHSKFPQTHKSLLLLASLFTIPFLFYLFSTARNIHRSSKFVPHSHTQFHGVLIDSGPTGTRIRVYQLLGDGNVPFANTQLPLLAASVKLRPALARFAHDPENAGALVRKLIEFAKARMPKREWGNSMVQLMAAEPEMEELEWKVRERILKSCRKVLRASGFVFKDEWARVLQEDEKGFFAWVAINYALGTLGGEPQETNGLVLLGGTSLQVIFTSNEVGEENSSKRFKLAGVTYNLQTQKLPKFGQDSVWESVYKRYSSKELMPVSNKRKGFVGNPCLPKGYELASSESDGKPLISHPVGNFTACRLEAMTLLRNSRDKCLHPPCRIVPSSFLELQGKPVFQQNLFYASEFFGVVPGASLFESEAAGKHYCEDDWDKLKNEHGDVDDLDLSRYCFSYAYMVALFHDNLGISMDDKRIGFTHGNGSLPLDWTLGAFVFQSLSEALELEDNNADAVIGNESVTYFFLFAFLLLAMLATFFVLQWRKPQVKTIYDLEKGRYIVTRMPR